MSKWKCEKCNSEFDNFQAQGFNHQIYCPLCYFKELYKREKTKNDKALKMVSNEKYLYIERLEKIKDILGDKE